MEQNTNDLSDFGYVELKEAAKLLTAYCEDTSILDGDGVKVEFNPNSGCVFLVDEDCNVAMLNGDKLELWYSCPYCGHEGFLEDMQHEPEDDECMEYMEQIGAPSGDPDMVPISELIALNEATGYAGLVLKLVITSTQPIRQRRCRFGISVISSLVKDTMMRRALIRSDVWI